MGASTSSDRSRESIRRGSRRRATDPSANQARRISHRVSAASRNSRSARRSWMRWAGAADSRRASATASSTRSRSSTRSFARRRISSSRTRWPGSTFTGACRRGAASSCTARATPTTSTFGDLRSVLLEDSGISARHLVHMSARVRALRRSRRVSSNGDSLLHPHRLSVVGARHVARRSARTARGRGLPDARRRSARAGYFAITAAFESRSGNQYGSATNGPNDGGLSFRAALHAAWRKARACCRDVGVRHAGRSSMRAFRGGVERVSNFGFVARERPNELVGAHRDHRSSMSVRATDRRVHGRSRAGLPAVSARLSRRRAGVAGAARRAARLGRACNVLHDRRSGRAISARRRAGRRTGTRACVSRHDAYGVHVARPRLRRATRSRESAAILREFCDRDVVSRAVPAVSRRIRRSARGRRRSSSIRRRRSTRSRTIGRARATRFAACRRR